MKLICWHCYGLNVSLWSSCCSFLTQTIASQGVAFWLWIGHGDSSLVEGSGAVLKGACQGNICSFLCLCPPALCCVRTCVSPEDLTAKVRVRSTSNLAWFQSLDLAFHNSLSCYKCILVPNELLRWWYFFF